VQLWDTDSGQPAGTAYRLGFQVFASSPGGGVALNPKGQRLVVLEEGRLRVLQLPTAPPTLREMELSTWVALGTRVDARGGAAESIPWEEWSRLREELRDAARGRGVPLDEPPPAATPPRGASPAGRGPIPPREPAARPGMLDLTAHYNAALTDSWHRGRADNDLRELGPGIRSVGGVPFDVRGIAQLYGSRLAVAFPRRIAGIPVDQPFRRLHVLHATAFPAPEGTRIGSFVLRFANGHTWEIPLFYGRDVRDWWRASDPAPGGPAPALTTMNAASPQPDSIRLFHSTWENPLPAVRVTAIDYVSAGSESGPFLLAITVQ
jgi:hypothetical protein